MPNKVRRKTAGTAGSSPTRPKGQAGDMKLVVTARGNAVLSAAQKQFNSLMRRLEKARTRHRREQERLDTMLADFGRELMPLIDEIHRLTHDLVVLGLAAMKEHKFTPRRRKYFSFYLRGKAQNLVDDSCGLTDDKVEAMQRVVAELTEPAQAQNDQERRTAELEMLRSMVESSARDAGVRIDLSGLDPNGNPEHFAEELYKRLHEAVPELPEEYGLPRGRKRTKTQSEREKRRQEIEAAKQRDLKSLYKQLAKVLHPDLELDPERRLEKEELMKRLTAAYASDDLRELLAIELEWMGAESSNLATATDEKLKVYSKVLQEQLDELNFQTSNLLFQPQYAALHRFKHPYLNVVLPISYHKEEIFAHTNHTRSLIKVLQAGGPALAKTLNEWSEEIARQERYDRPPF